MTDYKLLTDELNALADEDAYFLPLLANASALIYDALEGLNWAGFYLMREGRLVLGPFQGKPACIHIALGRGVCGTAVAENRTVRVANVHMFPGHIACDSASNSEIVLPIHHGGSVIGVLDIDSTELGRFTEEDERGLARFVEAIAARIIL